MGIDNIEILKPPPHDKDKCGGVGICLPCSTDVMRENVEIRRRLDDNPT